MEAELGRTGGHGKGRDIASGGNTDTPQQKHTYLYTYTHTQTHTYINK